MKVFVFGALGLLLFCFFLMWVVTHVHYHIALRHVKITLFGIVLRRIRISNIASVSKRRTDGLAENWWSTFRPNHRSLVIRRKRGLIKNVIITPRNRYVFKAELERAMERVNAPVQEPVQEVPLFTD
jgi:hypothetical protein